MKTLWLFTQKQTSKGYMTGRGYRQDGKPRFSKIMSSALRYETEQLALNKRNEIKDAMDKDIAGCEASISKANATLTTTYVHFGDFLDACRAFGGFPYHNLSARTLWDAECDKIRSKEVIPDFLKSKTGQINRYKKERDFFVQHIYIKPVEIGMRFLSQYKKSIEYVNNDGRQYTLHCNVCGGEIPNVQYFRAGYGNFCACPMCLETLIPKMQEVIASTSDDIKELWGKEKFLVDLG